MMYIMEYFKRPFKQYIVCYWSNVVCAAVLHQVMYCLLAAISLFILMRNNLSFDKSPVVLNMRSAGTEEDAKLTKSTSWIILQQWCTQSMCFFYI